MPWSSRSILSLREEFVILAAQPGANVRELCRRYDVSPTTAYKWLARFRDEGRQGLADRSRRPVHQPLRTAAVIEDAVLAVRDEHPAWGNRKIRARLLALGHRDVPSSSTIQSILRRYGRTADPADTHHKAYVRFERDAPNSLWQMDFKGHFPTSSGRCHPLTVFGRPLTILGRFARLPERALDYGSVAPDNGFSPVRHARADPHGQRSAVGCRRGP
jgi:transposase-like protein